MLPDMLVVRFQHSHPIASSTFANVGIEGPLANDTFLVEFGFDIRFADSRPWGSEWQIHSTGGLPRSIPTRFYGTLGRDEADKPIDKTTSVPIPKFVHSVGTLSCELRNQSDPSKYIILVRFLD